jgi:glycosyltransferase involved in cell wall biosynthesis
MRVVHVITGLGAGGAETMLGRLVEAQRAEVARVVSLTDVGPIGAKIQALGVPVAALGMRRGRPDPLALWRLVRLLSQDRPDVVQTWMYHADLLGGVAARILRIPVIWGVRHDRLSERDKALTRLTRRACALLSRWIPEKVVFNSEAARRTHAAVGYATSKLVVVPNGFDLSRFRPDAEARRAVRIELGIPQDAPAVGMVARYHPHKDHATFTAMAASVRQRCPSASFVLCGDGVDWSNGELAERAARAGLQPAIHLLGRRDDVERILAAVDVACLSSRTESFPNAIAEAMACGVPCVATDCGDVREIVGEAGRVVPVGDPAALAAAVLEVLRIEPEAREAMGAAARSRVARSYSIQAVALALREIQREAMASHLEDLPDPPMG